MKSIVQIGYICNVKGTRRIIFIFTLLCCFIPALARQYASGSNVSTINLHSRSISIVTAARMVNRSRQIENSTGQHDLPCLAETVNIHALRIMPGSRTNSGQLFPPLVYQIPGASSNQRSRVPIPYSRPLHHYHVVFPHHHFW